VVTDMHAHMCAHTAGRSRGLHSPQLFPTLLWVLRAFSLFGAQRTSVVGHACNPSTQEAETGGLTVRGQPRLHTETLSHIEINKVKFPL
jgi:hypothetical protein